MTNEDLLSGDLDDDEGVTSDNLLQGDYGDDDGGGGHAIM